MSERCQSCMFCGVDSYRVCEFLYEQRQEYDRILHCYLKDPLRKPQVFSYLRNILLLYTSATDKAKVEAQILDNIQVTFSITRSQIVYDKFHHKHTQYITFFLQVEAVILLIFIQEVPSVNVSQNTDYPDCGFSCFFSQSLQMKAGIISLNSP